MNFPKRFRSSDHKLSYAQCGEDLIVDFIFSELKLPMISYLDIGAHHPSYLSNTYLFYRQGFRGVCVEPDSLLCAAIKRKRKHDACLNVGVGFDQANAADFYVMSYTALNTFSKAEAERNQQLYNHKIVQTVQVPLMTINDIIRQYFSSAPNFISLDVEGLDLEILHTFDFAKYRSQVFCVETLTYGEGGTQHKVSEIIDLMVSNGYFPYADTYINTIFVHERAWNNRS